MDGVVSVGSQVDGASVVFMARQPIFDRIGGVTAYELLFRDPDGKPVGALTSKQEAAAIAQAVVDIGLDKLTGTCRAFVNIPLALLDHPALELLPADRVVLEILEDVEPTPELIETMKRLHAKGYTLALDDFVFDGRLDALLPYCQLVKVEYPVADKATLRRDVMKLKVRGITTLAEKVEEARDYRLCMSCGFDLFQGYFFAKPELVPGSAHNVDSGVQGQILQELQNPVVSMGRIEEILSTDARLTHQILKLAQSAAYGAASGVTSIRAALLAVGTAHLGALIALMMLADRSGGKSDLLILGTVRAKLCELMAVKLGYGASDKFFTVGLLSVLDAVLGLPMAEVLAQIPLSAELKTVLQDSSESTELGFVLRLAKCVESGDWVALQGLPVDPVTLGDCYLLALQWSEDIRSQVLSAAA